MLQSAWIAPVVWVMTAMAFLVLFQAAEHVHPLALALGSTFVGILLGALGFCTVVARQWPAVRPHISRESVADRLSAIKT